MLLPALCSRQSLLRMRLRSLSSLPFSLSPLPPAPFSLSLSVYPRRVMRAITGIITNMRITRTHERARASLARRDRAGIEARPRGYFIQRSYHAHVHTYVRTYVRVIRNASPTRRVRPRARASYKKCTVQRPLFFNGPARLSANGREDAKR